MESRFLIFFTYFICISAVYGQGPPILADKPIMLGQHKGTVRLAYAYMNADKLDARFIMPSVDFNVSNKISLELMTPFQKYIGSAESGFKLADIAVSGKYQYFKLDLKGKTIRLAVKGAHRFKVAKQHSNIKPVGSMPWGTYGGIIAGMESLRVGVIGDFGISIVQDIAPRVTSNFFMGKISLGIPLLKHVFPIRQLNVYLEAEIVDQLNAVSSSFYIAPGIQYVFGTLAFEFFYQRSIYQNGNNNFFPNKTLGVGIRYIY
jgi:hypothetical protein